MMIVHFENLKIQLQERHYHLLKGLQILRRGVKVCRAVSQLLLFTQARGLLSKFWMQMVMQKVKRSYCQMSKVNHLMQRVNNMKKLKLINLFKELFIIPW